MFVSPISFAPASCAKCSQRFADAIEAQMFETSAKLGTNIDTAVMALMREVLHHREFAAQNKGDGVQESARYRNESERKFSPSLCGQQFLCCVRTFHHQNVGYFAQSNAYTVEEEAEE